MPEQADRVTREIARLNRPLMKAARALEIIAFVGAVCGVVLGLVSTTVSTTTLSAGVFTGPATSTSHPYVALGIAIALESVISGVFFWAVARGLQVVAVDAAARYRVPLGDVRARQGAFTSDEGWF